ncbi:uncharacterized protein LOC111586552 isoform X1 [Amphiprion ocellaris]|uniref:uncharacterized protein LOC111586552 isoform X1 n=1 Tax=Amphiprion ocellaris TaxID=80972 RepID=UPI0024117751|nr:uncharacterized protein LOC111586552 isoform X1 [Amphiprion ocellaris]
MAGSLILLNCVHVVFIFLLLQGDCLQVEPNLCDSSCAGFPTSDLPYQKGVRYTYRYSTLITTTLHGSSAGRNGLALDCAVDIDVVSNCHLMMQIRNPQIKRLSPQKEHSVQRFKSLREALERTRLKFSLRGGKVAALCFQEGEQVWALNIKRALLSMLQTSTVASKPESEKEMDVYGTCTSRYERRGPLMLKTRDLKQCQQSRLVNFWPHSVALTEDTSVQLELHCVQRHGSTVMEEVNCTETVSMATGSGTTGLVKTQTVSTLLLLRAQPGNPFRADSLGAGVLTDLQFEDEGPVRPGKSRPSTTQKASQTVRMLCSLTSDPQLVSQEFLRLVFQLKDLTLSQLKTLWQEASFKCRNDWQPLLDALPACGSENCIILLTGLIRNKELEEEQAHSFLTTIALIPHPSSQIIGSINALLEVPELRSKAMLAGSSLAYQLCQRCSCSELPQVQTFIQTLEKTLKEGCEGEEPTRVTEIFYTLKSVGNAGLSAPTFVPLLNHCMLDHSTALELRLTAIQAFRRFSCSADRSVLLQLYISSQEDTEVRIAAYQQLMRCPDQDVFEAVKTTLRNETSSQVGSFVWSHLTNVLRSEDPVKQTLIESLPDDIISRDFEAEFLKYSSYSDYTVASGIGIKNVETTLIFSPKSFVPRSASANLTVYFHGRAHNLLEVDLHVENAEPLFKNLFSQPAESEPAAQNGKDEARRTRRKTDDGHKGEKETCLSSSRNYLEQARVMLFGRRKTEGKPKCWVGVKVFGNELSVFTCEDLYNQMNHVSLSAAGLAVKLLKGQEVQLNHRAVLMTEELLLPSLSGVPIKLGINMTSLLSLRLKGNVSYRDTSHFSLNGYIKPNAYVGLSARMGVDSALGQAAVEWIAELKSSTSLDGSVQLQEGRDVRVALNTPEDLMDIVSLSSRVFQLSGDHREEIKGPKSRVQKTTCTPKTWSKMVGWQLCSNGSYPSPTTGLTFPPPGPVHLSLRLLKLDRGLHYYLLEAAYSLHHQRGNWLPREASIHLLLATPQSSIPRDMSLDLAFNPHRFLLRINHPLKTIHMQGQLEQERNTKSGKLELSIDGVRYYVMCLVDTQTLLSEQRTRYHVEAKMAADAHPMILSANVTRGLGRKTSFSATVKNVFRETASLSVALERRRDSSSRQYSVEAELLLPGVVGSRMLGLMEQRGSLWSSMLRLKYGLGGDARQLRQECYTSQRLRSERDSNLTYIMRADHEFYCSNTAPINHKIHLRHEESPSHIKSALDMSYGKHWDEINNKHTVLLSQSFKNQSTQNHTSYTLEFNLQVPEKNLNYRTQLLHSHLTQFGSESSTHLKINYNNLMPLVAGLHWKSPPKDALQKTWEGSFNMDTPWLYIYTAHKLNQLQHHTLQITSELTASKWLTIRNLILEGFYRDRGREREARLELYTPAATYFQVGVWGVVGKRNLKASGSLSSLWTLPLRADVSLEASKLSHTLHMASTYGKHNVSFAAALNTADKSLKKRQVTVKMSLSKPKSPSTDLEFEGVVEELRRDKKMYQKTAMLQLRQPFQSFPQTLLLRETFTVDLLKGLYILESKAGFHGNREVIHTLTLGYQPPSPFVCSALTHPFSSDTVPSDSEICVTVTSNQTHKDLRGKLRVGSKERLTFFGQVQLNPLHSSHQVIKVKANFLHQLQLQLPSSAIMEGDVCWTPKNNNDFDYQARGKLRVERQECKLSVQLNGTSGRVGLYSSLSHPFKSKIPKTLEVKATADVSTVPGKGSSSVYVKADGKDRMVLNAQASHFLQGADRAVGLRLNFSQSLLPSATELHVNLAANMSSDSVFLRGSFTQGQEALLAQVKGSLKDLQGLQLAVSGDLRHTMTNLIILPPVLGLDGAVGQSDALIEGQLRVRVMETLYSVEMRHQRDPGEVSGGDEVEEGMMEKMSRHWLCVWSGVEHLCVNVSHQLWNQGRGEVYTRLSHSFHLLNTTGVPANSSAQVKWSQDGGQLSILAELQTGREHLKAEFHGERTDHLVPQWQYSSRLQHQVKALLERGLPSSFQAKSHYQLETDKLDTGLVLSMEDVRMVDILLNVESKNKTALLVASLWQQIQLLEGFIPTSLQMNCTGDATADRLSAQCYGNVADRPVEVRAFRSYRPHNRLCYGLSLAHISLSAQAKGCYSSSGQKELRANLTHSSVLLLTYLGVPNKSRVRFLLRPGPQRWTLWIGMVAGPWRTDLNVGLRLERPGLYGWHGLLMYGTQSVTHKAAVTGRMRLESWCHIWADVSAEWDSVSSSLLVSVRCTGVGRLAWVQAGSIEGNIPHKTSLNVYGQAGKDRLKGSLSFENQQDSLHCLLSVLLKDLKAEVDWSLQHHWASLAAIIPNRVDLQGSGQLHESSFSATIRLSINSCSALVNITAEMEPSTSFRATIHQNLATARVPEMVSVGMSTTVSRAQFKVESDVCSMLLLADQHRGGKDSRTRWDVFINQQCVSLKTLLPPQTSVNISVTRSGCFTSLSTVLQAEGEQKGSLNVSLTCHPHLSLRASVHHSIEAIKMLQFPTHGALLLNVSPALLPGVNVGLELGWCHFSGNLWKIKAPQTEAEESSYSVNVTSYCPSLEGTVLPVSLALQGLLSVAPCQLTVSSSVRADGQDLSLELHQRCRTPHFTGTLTHSFPGLRSQGLPQIISIEATAPGDPKQAGALFIKVGTCNIRANRIIESRGRTQWLWALNSTCPVLQAHVNGSVLLDHQGVWTAMLDSDLEGRRGFLRLHASAWPELSVEAELSHDLPALRGLPKTGRLRVTSRSGKQQYDAEALVQVEECAVGASGAVGSQSGLQGSLVYHNNCTVIQEWGSPEKVQTSGSLVFSTTFIKSQVSMMVDETELQTLVSVKKTKDKSEASLNLNHSMPLLKKLGFPVKAALTLNSGSHSNGSYFYVFNSSGGSQKFSQEMTVEKTSETVRVKSHLRHTVNYLKKLGVPANNSIQVELGAAEGKTLTLQSQLGGQLAGLRFKMKNFPVVKEIRGTLWHSWSWLHDTGLPLNMEALCSIQGVLSQLQSRAQLTVDGHKLLTSGLNISGADGRLSARLFYSPPAFNQTRIQQNLDTVLTAQFKGPLRSASLDIHCQDWRVRVMGDAGGWGSHGGTKEARATLKHTVQGQASPALQVEAWGRLTESQLRCSMAVNPELSSSLALIVQGHHTSHSKDLMVKVVQNIPQMLVYLPSQLNVRSQLNQSQSSVAGLLEVLSGRRRFWALGELAAIDSGYRQALEVKHSHPQLKPLPRTIVLRTVYEARKWSYQVQHAAVWGNQELSLSGLYSAPPAPEIGNHTLKVQITCVPRLTSLEVTLERSPHGRLDSVVLGWTRHGQLEQVKALSLWSRSEETNETKLELKQPFSSTLSQLSLHTLTHNSQREQHSSHQTHLSWESTVPVNVSLSLNKQWQNNSSRGQACVLLSAQQMEVSSVKGCVSVGREGNSYTQNAELRWDHSSVKQAMKYQKDPRGLHSLQVNVGLDRVSPVPCSSHTLQAKVQTNLRDRLEHTVLLGLCPPQPTLSWSGSHRVNSGQEMFYTRSRLSVTGRPNHCSFTFAITNSSTAQRTNMTLFSESRMGNWSVKVGGNALSWPRGSGLQVQATLDHREKMWLNGTVEGQCVQTTAGYMNGPDHSEDLTVAACVATNHTLKLDVQKRDGSSVSETLASVSLGAANQRLMLRASGCLESLAAAEERVHYLSSRIQKKLVERIKTLQHLLTEFRQQSGDSQLLQELSSVPFHVSQRVEALLIHRDRGLLALWRSSSLRRILSDSLPRVLSLLQHASLLGQQELRRPLATLAGVYQDLKGQRPEAMWREAVLSWADRLVEVLPALLENPHLRPLSQAGVTTLSVALDLAGQHTYQWIETRLATALSGVRKRLASVYKFTPGECSVIVSVPLPPLPWSRMAEAGLMEVLLEEWLLKPLLTVASVRPTAELYRLKRKIMDSPFAHQALLVADQFVVTFDGHLFELPGSCPLLLAQDVNAEPSFTLLLHPDPQSFLLIQMNNSTVSIKRNGQVKADCNTAVSHIFHSDDGVDITRRSNVVQVSNQNGGSVSCDLSLEVCSFTLDGWLHGASTGLFGTNDNDAGNDFPLRDGSQAENLEDFLNSWQMKPPCIKPPAAGEILSKASRSLVSCDSLFSSPDSPLSSCFRVVDPGRFLSVCELSSHRALCRLASAFVHLCQQNYIPLELPVQCIKA